MRVRRVAVLIDGGFFLKRLPKLVEAQFCTTAKQVAETARHLCKRHVQRLSHSSADQDAEGLWLDHVYRLFYYDAMPYAGVSHHPILNQCIEFGKSDVASFRRELFSELRHKRKFALRLGYVTKEGDWRLSPRVTRRILKIRRWVDHFEALLKHQVDTLILVTGDSDFVPAAKLARREGVEFLLDPLWQQVSDELNEHVDGVVSVFPKPAVNGQSLIAA